MEIQLSVGAACGCGEGMARQSESREGFLFPARGTGHTERGYPPRLSEKVIRFDEILS